LPGVVAHSPGGQFQASAAAWISMARPTAPTLRRSSQLVAVERLPPECWRPNAAASLGACSMRTSSQATSSSSAMIIGSEVAMPWPMSGFLAKMVTIPSAPIRTKAFSDAGPAASAARAAGAIRKASTSPAADALT
jgi:hypothetical protein